MHGASSLETLFPRRTLVRAGGPLYRQLADILRRPITEGALPVGEALPKEASIALHFGVSLITVRHALRDLESGGLIRKRSAKPAVVAARRPEGGAAWHMANFKDIAAYAEGASLRILSFRRVSSPLLQRHLGARDGEQGFGLRSVLDAGAEKKAYITTYFPADIGAGFKRSDFTDALIFETVQRKLGLRLDVVRFTVSAEVADDVTSEVLQVKPGSPLLSVLMLYQASDGRNVELSLARHPADRFSITYEAPNNLE